MARRRFASPAELTALGVTTWVLWAEASAVIGLRMLGMVGGRAVPGEALRMVAEKPPAFADAVLAAGSAAMRGQRPDQIAAAALAPLTRQVRANRRRLGAGR